MIFPIGQLNATIGQLMIPSNRDIFEEANDFADKEYIYLLNWKEGNIQSL
jgi:hypothetical protein